MQFCADVTVPDQVRGERCVMTCAWTDNEEHTRTKAVEAAHYYVETDVGYPWAKVTILALCEGCGGNGSKCRKRKGKPIPHSYHKCPDCSGNGVLFSLVDRHLLIAHYATNLV